MIAARPRAALVLAGLAAALALAGCETRAPELRELHWQLVDFHDQSLDDRYEALSLFARVSDADGADDLDELYLIFEAGELYWRLTADDWIQTDRNGAVWIGSTTLAMPGREPFPPGEYRVLVVDIGGERAELRFVLPARRSATPAPEVRATDTGFTVRGATDYELWVLAEGNLVATIDATEPVDLVRRLDGRDETRYQVYVYGHLPATEQGVLAGPYEWRRP